MDNNHGFHIDNLDHNLPSLNRLEQPNFHLDISALDSKSNLSKLVQNCNHQSYIDHSIGHHSDKMVEDNNHYLNIHILDHIENPSHNSQKLFDRWCKWEVERYCNNNLGYNFHVNNCFLDKILELIDLVDKPLDNKLLENIPAHQDNNSMLHMVEWLGFHSDKESPR